MTLFPDRKIFSSAVLLLAHLWAHSPAVCSRAGKKTIDFPQFGGRTQLGEKTLGFHRKCSFWVKQKALYFPSFHRDKVKRKRFAKSEQYSIVLHLTLLPNKVHLLKVRWRSTKMQLLALPKAMLIWPNCWGTLCEQIRKQLIRTSTQNIKTYLEKVIGTHGWKNVPWKHNVSGHN